MLQDIRPHLFNNTFLLKEARQHDYLVCSHEGKILLHDAEEGVADTAALPKCGDVFELHPHLADEARYLFAIDGRGFFLVYDELDLEGYSFREGRPLMAIQPSWMAFGIATALHLASWYQAHVYCGRCATALQHVECERALVCPQCGQVEYPKISPVVILAIVNGEDLLLTRAAHAAYKGYALVGGYAEIGETLEEAAAREAMEETGLQIKNLRYYKSQPWAFSESLLVGMFADVDGDTTVTLRDGELAEATWFERSSIPPEGNNASLTWEMILAFRAGLVS